MSGSQKGPDFGLEQQWWLPPSAGGHRNINQDLLGAHIYIYIYIYTSRGVVFFLHQIWNGQLWSISALKWFPWITFQISRKLLFFHIPSHPHFSVTPHQLDCQFVFEVGDGQDARRVVTSHIPKIIGSDLNIAKLPFECHFWLGLSHHFVSSERIIIHMLACKKCNQSMW